MQHFLKIGGKRYGEVRNFKKVRKFASSNLKFRSSKFKFTEILICNPGSHRDPPGLGGADAELLHRVDAEQRRAAAQQQHEGDARQPR